MSNILRYGSLLSSSILCLQAQADRQNFMDSKTVRGLQHVMVHFLAGADDFDAFVNFVETTVGKGFISLLDSLMQKIIIDILHRASDSSRWAGGYTLPDTVLQTATHALVNLSDIQNRRSAADFLAGMRFALTPLPPLMRWSAFVPPLSVHAIAAMQDSYGQVKQVAQSHSPENI